VTDWLQVCRDAAAAVAVVLQELPTRAEREPGLGRGQGGDETTAIDAAAEEAILRRLGEVAATGTGFTLVSEELGERRYGAGGDGPRVVCDPIDGSLNAKRGIPFFALSLAVASGPRIADVELGYVRDFGTGEEWVARLGEGAFLDSLPLEGPSAKKRVEILAFEATRTDLVAAEVAGMVGFAYRIRIMGSLALSLCHLAAGRVDAVVSLKPARSVDIAAAQLLVRERGLALELPDDPPFLRGPLDLVPRSRVVAAATPELCAELASRLSPSL
jgi:myo-inositol-1(or 4)-monophosphatase